MSGKIEIFIGPNGFGKTTHLESIKANLEKSGIPPEDILYLQSEIKLLDEVKDTRDDSTTMEYIISELIQTPSFIKKRDELFDEINTTIAGQVPSMNAICDSVLSHNGQTRGGDFISDNPKILIKNIVSINQGDIKGKMGSGQRMLFLLRLVEKSSKQHIFLDEPEKYSHPSLLNETARIINDLVAGGKDIYLATHSPKLLSMLDFDLDNLQVINDISHKPKPIPFDEAIAMGKKVGVGSLPDKNKRYYLSEPELKECLTKYHRREFLEALFSKRVYLCEGVNDAAFINYSLQTLGGYYDDYTILSVWGKFNIPAFFAIFSALGIDVVILFDRDDEAKKKNMLDVNKVIRSLATSKTVEFDPCIEEQFKYQGEKYDTLGFIEHLEGLGVLDRKYKLS